MRRKEGKMSRKLLQQVIGVTLVMLFVVGCGAGTPEPPTVTPTPVPPTPTPVPPFDGTWLGTTSQGKKISFTIADNAIAKFHVDALSTNNEPFGFGREYGPQYSSSPQPLTQDGFLLTGTVAGFEFPYTISGTFSSKTTVSGTLQVLFSDTRKDIVASATWSAAKQ
jgi:hypothetical protein